MPSRSAWALIITVAVLPATSQAGACDAYYPFDATLEDASSNGFHGQLLDKSSQPAGGARFEPGKRGQALRLTGGTFVRTPLDLNTENCPQVSITAWVYFEDTQPGLQTLISTGFGRGPRLDRGGSNLSAYAADNEIRSGNSVRPGIWMFVAGVWDYSAGVHRLYWRNRYVEESIGTSKRLPQEFFWIGANGYNSSVSYVAANILLDDVRVWGRVLTSAEIAELQAGGSRTPVMPVEIVPVGSRAEAVPEQTTRAMCNAHFPLNGSLKDISGNAYHGQAIDLSGVPTPGALSFVPGKHGQALRLDGNAAMIAPVDLHFDLCPQITVTAWVYFEDEPGGGRSILSTGFGSGPRFSAAGTNLQAWGGANEIRAKAVFRQGEWIFVAGLWDYENGVHRVIAPNGTWQEPLGDYSRPPQQDFWLGTYAYNQSLLSPAAGLRIDDVRTYGRLLNAQELTAVATDAPDEKYDLPGAKDTNGEEVQNLEKDILAAQSARATQSTAALEAPDNLPADRLEQDIATIQEAGFEEYQRQQVEEFENRFGPRNRTQVAIDPSGAIGFAAIPDRAIDGPANPDKTGIDIVGWVSGGTRVQELLRLKRSSGYMAIAEDGTVALQGPTEGRHVALVDEINQILANHRPIDLVAENGNGYLIVSGTNVVAKNIPGDALSWVKGELADLVQVTAFSFLGGNSWIGVSNREVKWGSMTDTHYGAAIRDLVRRLRASGERIDDISVSWRFAADGTATGDWAVATDRQIFFHNGIDCDNHEDFGASVESQLNRRWSCEVPVTLCPNTRLTWSPENMQSPADPSVWEVNALVTIGIADYDGEEVPRFDCWLENSLQRAEQLYDREPPLRLRLRTQRLTEAGGRTLSRLEFADGADYRRFMEQNFDNAAPTATSGYIQILVTDELCIGRNNDGSPDCSIGGRATFPHDVEPFSRKYGITLEPSARDDTVLAHELGHFQGLKHTFEPYGITTNPCNKDYDANWLKMEERHCRSCLSGMDLVNDTCAGPYNVMDYCTNPNPPQQVYINDCQQRRASDTRDGYMTNDGRTKYGKMKGSAGAGP